MTRLWPEGQAIEVCDCEEIPGGFRWSGASHRVLEVCNRWRVHTRWWEPNETIWREYWKVATDGGLLCLIFHDFLTDRWYLQRVYD